MLLHAKELQIKLCLAKSRKSPHNQTNCGDQCLDPSLMKVLLIVVTGLFISFWKWERLAPPLECERLSPSFCLCKNSVLSPACVSPPNPTAAGEDKSEKTHAGRVWWTPECSYRDEEIKLRILKDKQTICWLMKPQRLHSKVFFSFCLACLVVDNCIWNTWPKWLEKVFWLFWRSEVVFVWWAEDCSDPITP